MLTVELVVAVAAVKVVLETATEAVVVFVMAVVFEVLDGAAVAAAYEFGLAGTIAASVVEPDTVAFDVSLAVVSLLLSADG